GEDYITVARGRRGWSEPQVRDRLQSAPQACLDARVVVLDWHRTARVFGLETSLPYFRGCFAAAQPKREVWSCDAMLGDSHQSSGQAGTLVYTPGDSYDKSPYSYQLLPSVTDASGLPPGLLHVDDLRFAPASGANASFYLSTNDTVAVRRLNDFSRSWPV